MRRISAGHWSILGPLGPFQMYILVWFLNASQAMVMSRMGKLNSEIFVSERFWWVSILGFLKFDSPPQPYDSSEGWEHCSPAQLGAASSTVIVASLLCWIVPEHKFQSMSDEPDVYLLSFVLILFIYWEFFFFFGMYCYPIYGPSAASWSCRHVVTPCRDVGCSKQRCLGSVLSLSGFFS